MKITIFQKGGNKNHELIEEATRYFAKKLMSTRMINTLNLKIKVRSTTLPKNAIGVCSTLANGSISSKDFDIEIHRDISLKKQVETLAHELVHIWQKTSGMLQFRKWKSDNNIHIRWNGEETGLSNAIPYLERPWEKEAYFLESHLYNSFKAVKKGFHDDMPDLDKNLKTAIRCVINKRENDKSLAIN